MSDIHELAGAYRHLTDSELSTLKAEILSGITALNTTGQSYSISGRSFTRGDLDTLSNMLAAVSLAQNQKSSTTVRRTYVRHS